MAFMAIILQIVMICKHFKYDTPTHIGKLCQGEERSPAVKPKPCSLLKVSDIQPVANLIKYFHIAIR